MIKIYANAGGTEKVPEDPHRAKVQQWLAAEQPSGAEWKLVTLDAQDIDGRNKKTHDLKGALRTLAMATASLKNGYKFDDDLAQAKIDAIAKAVHCLQDELPNYLAILQPN